MAPDVGTDARVMAWLMDQYSLRHGYTAAIVTGKPPEVGGSFGRDSATGRGVVHMLTAALHDHHVSPDGLRASLQGFGNVGRWAAHALVEIGARVISVQDGSGCVLSERGIDVKALERHVREAGGVAGFPAAEAISSRDGRATECDVFIPAAMGGMVDLAAAELLDCAFVIEGANSPTTPDAERVLIDRGVTVIPDVMANVGGVVVSYSEWVQNLQHMRWTAEDVEGKLKRRMHSIYDDVVDRAMRRPAESLRIAVLELALERVLAAGRRRNFTSN
jgi:glutamate dehydrogenase (NAD(P)+)